MSEQVIESRYLDVAGAATYMSTSQMTVRRLIATHQLRALKIGRKLVRIDKEDIDRWIQGSDGSCEAG
jgi:excisionase family DNA binding protein